MFFNKIYTTFIALIALVSITGWVLYNAIADKIEIYFQSVTSYSVSGENAYLTISKYFFLLSLVTTISLLCLMFRSKGSLGLISDILLIPMGVIGVILISFRKIDAPILGIREHLSPALQPFMYLKLEYVLVALILFTILVRVLVIGRATRHR